MFMCVFLTHLPCHFVFIEEYYTTSTVRARSHQRAPERPKMGHFGGMRTGQPDVLPPHRFACTPSHSNVDWDQER